MVRLVQLVSALRRHRGGVTALEFSLLAGAFAVVIASAVHTLGTAVNGVLIDVSGAAW
jgi:Flp pilus assembly pilin Flp